MCLCAANQNTHQHAEGGLTDSHTAVIAQQVDTHTHTHTHTHTRTHTHPHTHTHTRTLPRTHAHTHTHTNTFTHTHTHRSTKHTHTRTHAQMWLTHNYSLHTMVQYNLLILSSTSEEHTS